MIGSLLVGLFYDRTADGRGRGCLVPSPLLEVRNQIEHGDNTDQNDQDTERDAHAKQCVQACLLYQFHFAVFDVHGNVGKCGHLLIHIHDRFRVMVRTVNIDVDCVTVIRDLDPVSGNAFDGPDIFKR